MVENIFPAIQDPQTFEKELQTQFSLDLMGTKNVICNEYGTNFITRFDLTDLKAKSTYLYARILLFKELTNPRNCSTSADPCNKNVHLASCIFPDLWTSCLIVNLQKNNK